MGSRTRGGIYAIRCRKPSAFLGLPLIGRHWAYVGLTNSFYHRKNQHLLGDVVYGQAAKPWSDLAPRFYKLLPLPTWITHKGALFSGRWTLELLETLFIWLLIPVYNVSKQAPYNLRRISLRSAQRQRWARQQSGIGVNIGRALARWALAGVVFAGLIYTGWEAWM